MKIAIKWGLFLGAGVVTWTLLLHLLGFYTTNIAAGQVADIVATVLPILAIVFAIRERRGRGALTLGQALSTGVVVGLVSIPISAGFLWAYHHFINPQWNELLIAHQRDVLAQSGASAEAIATMEARQRASGTDAAQVAGALIGTTLISTVISLIAGAILRRKPVAAG